MFTIFPICLLFQLQFIIFSGIKCEICNCHLFIFEVLHILLVLLYPECPHEQCVGLAYPWTRVRPRVVAARLAICRPRLHFAIRGAHVVLPLRVWSATSQLDLVSDSIVRSWLWSTATKSYPLDYFSIFLQVVDN